ncbi:MAG: hypothetical protein [Caudoviricetes sp.]|nr:MAG: hypothetical protein [Caudoviricetes sp.]
MDMKMRMVYETEGQQGGDIRDWHGEQARQQAEHEEYQRVQHYLEEREDVDPR